MLHNRSLFIFRQDLRIHDNTGLIKAIKESKEIIPVFIFDTNVLDTFPKHDKRLSFLVDALKQLDADLHKR